LESRKPTSIIGGWVSWLSRLGASGEEGACRSANCSRAASRRPAWSELKVGSCGTSGARSTSSVMFEPSVGYNLCILNQGVEDRIRPGMVDGSVDSRQRTLENALELGNSPVRLLTPVGTPSDSDRRSACRMSRPSPAIQPHDQAGLTCRS